MKGQGRKLPVYPRSKNATAGLGGHSFREKSFPSKTLRKCKPDTLRTQRWMSFCSLMKAGKEGPWRVSGHPTGVGRAEVWI